MRSNVSKSVEERYKDMSRDEIIERCEMYRRQIGGMSKRPNVIKQELVYTKKENEFLRNTISKLFDEYVESHTLISSSKQTEISPLEYSVIKQFETILDSLEINHVNVPSPMNNS